MTKLILIGLAGLAGTLCRYGLTRLPWPSSLPFGTLCINVADAFLAGFCHQWLWSHHPEASQVFPILFIGFFGAFTTFSTFALDSARFLTDGMAAKCLLNIALQNILGIASAACGLMLARMTAAFLQRL